MILALSHLDGRETPLDRIEAPLVDLRFLLTGPRPAPAGITIVAIDDDTVRDAGAYPLPRGTLARLVASLRASEAKAIALDVLLIDPGPAEGDSALAAALRNDRTVIAAAGLFGRGDPTGDVPAVERMIWPLPAFRSATGIGLVNIVTDHAGTPRHVPLLVRAEGTLLSSFPLRVASLAARAEPVLSGDRITIGSTATRTDLGLHLPLRFYGPRGTIRTISARDVLAGSVAAEDLSGHIVVIGATAVGTGDTFATPFDPVLPGVEVLTTAIAHLTTGDGLRRTLVHRRIDAAATVILPVLTVLMIALRRIAVGFVVLAIVTASWTLLTILAFGQGSWLSMSVPIAGLMPPAILYVLARLWLDQRVERRLEATQDTLRRFQPRAIADRLAAEPAFLAEPVQQKAAVLFVDLSGFTGLSERLGPERTRDILKELHSVIETEATRQNGIVLSFMGDGAMVVFGLPAPSPDDPCRAIQASLALADRIGDWLAGLPDAGGRIGVRVGAHYGPVVVSRLGAETHEHITATGDSVNVASRLLEVARQEGALVVLSGDLLRAAGEPAIEGLGAEHAVAIRGRHQPLSVRIWGGREAGP